MNQQRRRRIDDIIYKISAISVELNRIYREEEEAYDNRGEGFQQTESGLESEEALSSLDEAITHLNDARDFLMEISPANDVEYAINGILEVYGTDGIKQLIQALVERIKD